MSFDSEFVDAKEQVRQAIGIVDLVRSYIELRPKGRHFVGHCPWHNDSNPSLRVDPERETWRCWVCDIGGDLFSFVMRREQVEFREALELLADRAGIELPRFSGRPKAEPGSSDHKPTLFRALEWAEKQFHNCLLKSSEARVAREYLEERGITPASWERFHLGFSPDGWQWLLDRSAASGFTAQVLEAVGLLGRSSKTNRHYDRFRGRVIFPIRDTVHRCVAFGGRVLPGSSDDRAAKYVNSPETRLFSKSEMLYGLDLARDEASKRRELVIVEGYTDVVMAHQTGVTNVAAVLGTALNERHIANLRRFTDQVALVLDGDDAGRKKANSILELFVAADMDLRILTLPDNLDPFDFFAREGAEAFRAQLNQSVDALEHKVREATRGVDLLQETHKSSAALDSILATVARAPATAASQLRRPQLLARLARRFGTDEAEVRRRFQYHKTPTRRPAQENQPATPQAPTRPDSPQDRELLGIIAHHPELAAEAVEKIALEQLACDLARKLFEHYVTRVETGHSLEFQEVLSSMDDPRLQSTFVALDEEARLKAEPALESAPERLAGLIRHFDLHRERRHCRETEFALQNGNLNPEEELQALQKIIASQRSQQGISAPTEG